MLSDTWRSPKASEERPVLLYEIERLLKIYGHNGSFRNYAGNLLDFIRIRNKGLDRLRWKREMEPQRGFSAIFQVCLGRLSKQGLPIPADMAFVWWKNHPEIRLRSPAKRCPNEFAHLFEIEYRKKFGEGLIVKPNKTRLTIDYRPASGSFGHHDFSIDDTGLPDLTVLSGPLNKLSAIADACMEQLDPYSRYIGRKPEERDSLPALALLPRELVENKREPLKPLLEFLVERLHEKESCVLDANDLLAFWPLADQTKVTKTEAVGMGQLLASMGAGMEPDIRFGMTKIQPGGKVCLFRLSDPEVYSPTPAFRGAGVVLHLAAVIAGADGVIDPEEERQLEMHLESILHLADPERERLRARVKWLLAEPPGLAGIKKRLSGIVAERRRSISEFLIAVAGADGRVDPSEIKTLKKIYGLLGLEPESIHSDIHRLQTRMTGQPAPVSVGSGPAAPGFIIPLPPDKEKKTGSAIRLDSAIVAETLKNTAMVQQMLADVFVEEEPEPKQTVTGGHSVKSVQGLDDEHSELFHQVITNSRWGRAEFDEACDRLGLMPDGAIETINEAAFVLLEEPVLDGDDPLDVNQQIAKEMLA